MHNSAATCFNPITSSCSSRRLDSSETLAGSALSNAVTRKGRMSEQYVPPAARAARAPQSVSRSLFLRVFILTRELCLTCDSARTQQLVSLLRCPASTCPSPRRSPHPHFFTRPVTSLSPSRDLKVYFYLNHLYLVDVLEGFFLCVLFTFIIVVF